MLQVFRLSLTKKVSNVNCNKLYPNSSSDELSNSKKKAATTQRRPVILQTSLGDKGGRPLASYNPITIDRCLGKAIRQYESCKPIRNGNLLIICKTSNQVKTLLDLDSLSDSAGNSIPIIATTTNLLVQEGLFIMHLLRSRMIIYWNVKQFQVI